MEQGSPPNPTCSVSLQRLSCSMQAEEGTDWLLELLTELQLQQYFLRIRDELNVTRLSHFEYVKNEDLEKIGMGRPGAYAPPNLPPYLWLAAQHLLGIPEEHAVYGLEGPPSHAGLVTATVSCRPAAAVGGSEAEESHVQAEILDEQGRDGRGAGVAGKQACRRSRTSPHALPQCLALPHVTSA